MRRPARRLLFLPALAAAGLCAALVGTRSASAFPPGVCHGTSCTGSTSVPFTGVNVCVPGATTYWEDSYIPANVKNPHLAKLTITPRPPCTGATVSAPTSDPWPASNTDPDGQPAGKKEAGKAIFRFRWTVTVPQGSTSNGTMNVAWTLDWTAPTSGGGGTTGATTTTPAPCPTQGEFPAKCRYDLEMQISAPATIDGAESPQRVEFKLTVYNNGPASSPPIPVPLRQAPFFESASLRGANKLYLHVVKVPPGCTVHDQDSAECPLRALKPHGEESFAITVLWTVKAKQAFAEARKAKQEVSIGVSAYVNGVGARHGEGVCASEETSCANNQADEDTQVR